MEKHISIKKNAVKGIKVLDYCITQCSISYENQKEKIKEVQSTIFLTPKNNSNSTWQICYKSYLNSLLKDHGPEEIDCVVINDFLELINVAEIKYSVLHNDDIDIDIKSISVICSNNQTFNLMIPGFEFNSDYTKIGENIRDKKNQSFIAKYAKHYKEINNIYIIPSLISSCVEYVENDIETTNKANSFYISNIHTTGTENLYLNNDEVITNILNHFYNENIDFVDGYYSDDTKVILKFSNGKNIVIEDKNIIPKLACFIDEFNNTLIDIKIGKRKVLRNERNDNGKNG